MVCQIRYFLDFLKKQNQINDEQKLTEEKVTNSVNERFIYLRVFCSFISKPRWYICALGHCHILRHAQGELDRFSAEGQFSGLILEDNAFSHIFKVEKLY